MVVSLSFQLGMVRVPIMAGTAQAMPLINGITERPFNPRGRISLSIRKLALAIYPVSSSMAMKANNKAICGTNTTTPLNPAKIPLINKEENSPGGNTFCPISDIFTKQNSMAFIGYLAMRNMLWKMTNKMTKKKKISPCFMGQYFINPCGK